MKNLRGLGIGLLLIGILSFVLPLVGLQFRIINVFGPGSAPIVGVILAVIGIVLIIGSMAGRTRVKPSTGDKSQTQ